MTDHFRRIPTGIDHATEAALNRFYNWTVRNRMDYNHSAKDDAYTVQLFRVDRDNWTELVSSTGATLNHALFAALYAWAQKHPGAQKKGKRTMNDNDTGTMEPSNASDRDPAPDPIQPPREVEHIMQFFAFEHLPPRMQEISRPFFGMATALLDALPRNPERTVALRKLLESKDAAVRAFIAR